VQEVVALHLEIEAQLGAQAGDVAHRELAAGPQVRGGVVGEGLRHGSILRVVAGARADCRPRCVQCRAAV
jgi:hypothetical protein